MNRNRTILAGLGVVVFLVAGLFVVDPRAATDVPIQPVVDLLGNPYFLVAAFGVVALGSVLAVLVARALRGIDQAVLPTPEEVHRVPRAGEEFDDFIEDPGLRAWVSDDRHREVRERLHEAAVTAEMRAANCPRAEAEARVDRGEWTDDETVAAFLATERTPDLGARLVAAIRGESPFQRAARRTADEVARRAGGAR